MTNGTPEIPPTAVLLGAGASRDAGLPVSTSLTQRIAAEIDNPRSRYSGEGKALNLAIGALIAYDTARGGNPYDGIDVERLFSAIQMLGDRDAVEITPFVSSWNAALESVGRQSYMPSFFRTNFVRELEGSSDMFFDKVFREGVEAVVGSNSEPVFKRLEQTMLGVLRQALDVDAAKINYLAPLLTISDYPIQIATLNYDLAVERLAERADFSLTTGIEVWNGNPLWSWEDKETRIRLLKLHGSLNWWFQDSDKDSPRSPIGPTKLREDVIKVGDDAGTGYWDHSKPALVFGRRGKMRSDGPFIPMLLGFDAMLQSSQRLVIIGYSFRDDHINLSIRRWFNREPRAEVIIVDPSLKNLADARNRRGTFLGQLVEVITEWGPGGGGLKLRPPHRVVAKGAADGLLEIFGPGPALK